MQPQKGNNMKKPATSKKKTIAKQPKFKLFGTRKNKMIGIVALLFIIVAGVSSFVLYQKNTADAASCDSYQFTYNSRGTCVKYIQNMLNGITVVHKGKTRNGTTLSSTILTSDGVFGSRTSTKVKNFQGWYGTTKDGIVGPKTWAGLCYYAKRLSWNGNNADDGAKIRTAIMSAQLAGC